jgi:hypothetical protein
MKRCLALTIALASLAAVGTLGASPAVAASILNLDIHHNPTSIAPGSPGAVEASTETEGSANNSEVQVVEVRATDGAFKLTFEGQSTTDLAFNASETEVSNALRALPAIGSLNVNVGKGVANPELHTYKVTFAKALAKKDVPQLLGSDGAAPLRLATSFSFDVRNVGDSATSGSITLTVQLPTGLSRGSTAGGDFQLSSGYGSANVPWSCPGSPGDTAITCTTSGPIPRHTLDDALTIRALADPSLAPGEVSVGAEVSGGGAADGVAAQEPTKVDPAPAGFGILAPSFVPDFFEADAQTTVRRSGAHPDQLILPFDLTSIVNTSGNVSGGSLIPAGNIRDVSVDFPPGFLGNPTAVGECSQALFTLGSCPGSAQVGRIDVRVTGLSEPPIRIGLFNLSHPRGVVTDIAFALNSNPVHIKASLDPANRYAITTTTAEINETLPALHQRVTVWGVPADHSHDSERCLFFKLNNAALGENDNGDTSKECSTDHEPKPFLTVPSQCTQDNVIRLHHYDSWQNAGAFGPEIDYTMPGHQTDCDVPRFDPSVELTPTGHEANTPTGLDVHIHIPQNENALALATPPVKSTTVTLPKGMVLSPSFADGLQGCSEGQFGISHAGVPNGAPIACPDASRIGEVEISSPLLPKALEGSMYLAKQEANPFGSLFAFYLALHDTEERGILVKIAGKLSLDPVTGQITQTFDDLPQLPFEDLTLKFRSGERAPLVNPPTCGQHTIAVKIASYAQPNAPVDASNTYTVSEGPGGAPCAASEAARPFEPKLTGGTLNPVAGAFSPMSLRVSRTDADQELATVQGSAPLGLTASLRGIGRCSETQIAAARARSAPGEGALEQASPSCPASSQVGTVLTGAGAGPSPIYIPGKIYMAGPYKGAPLSGVAIVPAIAGPADLGTIVVRAPAYVDPRTAQIRIVSDPLPQIVHGVLVRVRDVRIKLDRPGFTLNPTSCEPKSLDATLTSTVGAVKALSERFQVGDCGNLGFKPRLSLKLRGGTQRGDHPALRSVFRPRQGDANLEGIVLRLPHSAFLDQAHIRTICTRVQFAADACPAGAIYGRVRVFTPLLDEPLEGPVYLRSSNHNLPDLVFDLHGTIDLEAVARIDSKYGGIRTTFTQVPDAPLEKAVVNIEGAKKGLIVNSTNLCAREHRADARLAAHNGRRLTIRPLVQASCGKKKHG